MRISTVVTRLQAGRYEVVDRVAGLAFQISGHGSKWVIFKLVKSTDDSDTIFYRHGEATRLKYALAALIPEIEGAHKP